MLLKNILPFIRQAVVGGVGSRYQKTDIFRLLKTPDCRLFYIISGNGSINFKNNTYKLKAGTTVLFQSGTEYIWSTDHAEIISINFDYTMNFKNMTTPFHPIYTENFKDSFILEKIDFEDAQMLNQPLCIDDAFFIEHMLRSICSAFYLNDKFAYELCSSYMKAIITSIAYNSISNPLNKNTINASKVLHYIQSHYNKNITNEEIARHFHFNSSYIGKIFKQHTGVPMHKFLVDYRINMAKELLRTQNTSVSQISYQVGFSDPHHFVKYFKQIVKKTPTEYRNSTRQIG